MQTHTHTRTVTASAYGLPGRWAKVQVLPAGNRGRNTRGLTGAKRGWGGGIPKGAKRAKKQNTQIKGSVPHVRTTNWSNV